MPTGSTRPATSTSPSTIPMIRESPGTSSSTVPSGAARPADSTTPIRAPSGPSACITGRCSSPMPPPSPAPASGGAETPAPPDWYSHGLNRVGYYRLATAAAGALPRPARLLLARGLGRLFARAVPAERRAVRSNLSRVLAGERPETIEARVSETFANFGAFFADLLTLNRRPGTDLRAYRSEEH